MFATSVEYFKKHKLEFFLIFIIIIIAAFFRLYKISDYMTFLGDEGRDAIVAKNIIKGDLTLLGPRASAGDFFLGPAYYYLMAPFLLLSNFDPVGPAIMVALFGIATVYLVYHIGRKLFSPRTGLIAASLYAVSPLVIAYSRSSWNPNLMPFVSLLILYLLYIAVKNQRLIIFGVVGLLLGIAMQLHYLSTFLVVIVFFFVLTGEFLTKKKMFVTRSVKNFVTIFIGFIIGFSPFLLFEIRHGFPNITTIFKFVFSGSDEKVQALNYSFLGNIWDVFYRLYARLVTKYPPPEQINITENLHLQVWMLATIILAVISIVFLFRNKNKLTIMLMSLWLFFGVFLFGFYSKSIYDYYLGFMFPLPFLLIGNLIDKIANFKDKKSVWIGVALSLFVGLFALNLSGNPFRYEPNKQKDQAKKIAETVLSKTNGKPFNFALLTRGNSDHVYRYFFEINDRTPVTILNTQEDPQRKSVTDQLMIVCEYSDCQPLGNSLWEVAGFGRAEIAGVWDVPFVKIYRLVHYYRPAGFDLSKLELDANYEKPELGFSFKYPGELILEDSTNLINSQNKPYLRLKITTPQVTDEDLGQKSFNVNSVKSNSMRLILTIYENKEQLGIEDLIIRSEGVNLPNSSYKQMPIPVGGSYVFEGIAGEVLAKIYYFKNQNYFYIFSLRGGMNDPSDYSQEAENLFDQIVGSINFK